MITKMKYMAAIAAVACGLTACDDRDNPLDKEQYVKQVYLVGANEVLQTKRVDYAGNGELYVSVAIGGSQLPDQDVTITLGTATQDNIDRYNHKNVVAGGIKYQALPTDWYSLPSWDGTIRRGEVYTRIPIKVDPSRISCDSLYVIPLKITKTSAYQTIANDRHSNVAKDTCLLVHLQMVNAFSGSYTFSGVATEMVDGVKNPSNVSSISTARTATAVNGNTIRLFQNAIVERYSNLGEHAYTITVNDDNSLTLKTWKDMPIVDGAGTYNPADKTFTFWYDYTVGEKTFRMEAKLKKDKEL